MSELQNDTLMSVEWRAHCTSTPDGPLPRLYEAMIERAILDLKDWSRLKKGTGWQRHCAARIQRDLRELEDWFRSDDTDNPLSFLNCCEGLGVDPGWLRRKVSTVATRTEDPPPGVRACRECGEVYPLEEFPSRSDYRDGRGTRCKPCSRPGWVEKAQRARQGFRQVG